ncbi:MAG: capsule biosynthesis protein [Sphingobium sp.]|nr:MAG: capsule biosynthesis protein [Sphingobium sp.]
MARATASSAMADIDRPLLCAPPFPGADAVMLGRPVSGGSTRVSDDLDACVAAMRSARVGGTFWAAQPSLDPDRTIVLRPSSDDALRAMLAQAADEGVSDRIMLWLPEGQGAGAVSAPVIQDPCDPWHVLGHATGLWVDGESDIRDLAHVALVPVRRFDHGANPILETAQDEAVRYALQQRLITQIAYTEPFDGLPSDALSTIALLSHWRTLIDANRSIAGAFGFAHWKKAAVEPLLWGGSEPVRFLSPSRTALDAIPPDRAIAIWKARVPDDFLDAVEARSGAVHEVEDGFIRSAGLGANCVPPLSIVADRIGVHFDPSGPSELENILQRGGFTPEMLARAERLRVLIVETGISKYDVGGEAMERPGGARRHILVTGQVEDDRSVLFGGGAVAGNFDLLRRARAQEPDAYIIYKPHPDVEAGHRKGRVAEADALAYADQVEREAPISALLDMVDGVHVLTSLAGFEALLRGRQVTTHGVPFYAGWGLTTDLGDVPVRRSAQRDVNEMVAAVLMLYPRYLDPVTSLPCPPEVLVRRLVGGARRENRVIVSLRRLQGLVRQNLSRMRIWT